jgi:hypothetical protein
LHTFTLAKIKHMKIDNIRLEALRYQRAYSFTVSALHTLCCASGGMRDRLQQIDKEFFTLTTIELPERERLREKFRRLHELVTSNKIDHLHEGRIAATIGQLHHTKLKAIAQLIWNIHVEFSAFMMFDEN